jgi:hypothetical protein
MNILKVIPALLAIVLSGCSIYKAPPQVANYYFLDSDKDLASIGRVAIIELTNESSYPQIASEVTEALFHSFQKRQLFGLSIVYLNDPAWRSLQLDVSSTYTLEQLLAIRKALKCDAMLIGTITSYQPYPHMSIGLNLKLIDLKDGQLVWALEQIWDSADKTTESHIKSYFKKQLHSDFAPLHERVMLLSPIEFIKFVACEAAETM